VYRSVVNANAGIQAWEPRAQAKVSRAAHLPPRRGDGDNEQDERNSGTYLSMSKAHTKLAVSFFTATRRVLFQKCATCPEHYSQA
jgi:hypothetical protein